MPPRLPSFLRRMSLLACLLSGSLLPAASDEPSPEWFPPALNISTGEGVSGSQLRVTMTVPGGFLCYEAVSEYLVHLRLSPSSDFPSYKPLARRVPRFPVWKGVYKGRPYISTEELRFDIDPLTRDLRVFDRSGLMHLEGLRFALREGGAWEFSMPLLPGERLLGLGQDAQARGDLDRRGRLFEYPAPQGGAGLVGAFSAPVILGLGRESGAYALCFSGAGSLRMDLGSGDSGLLRVEGTGEAPGVLLMISLPSSRGGRFTQIPMLQSRAFGTTPVPPDFLLGFPPPCPFVSETVDLKSLAQLPGAYAKGRLETVNASVLRAEQLKGQAAADTLVLTRFLQADASVLGLPGFFDPNPSVLNRDTLLRVPAEMLNASLSGFTAWGADLSRIPPVAAEVEDLGQRNCVRSAWIQALALAPVVLLPHDPLETLTQGLSEDLAGSVRATLRLRRQLSPYFKNCFWSHTMSGVPVALPVGFPDASSTSDPVFKSDAWMIGADLLVAPQLDPDSPEREVQLPAGRWCELRSGIVHQGGATLRTGTPDGSPFVALREGSFLPRLGESDAANLILECWPMGESVISLPWPLPDSLGSTTASDDWLSVVCERTRAQITLSLTSKAKGKSVRFRLHLDESPMDVSSRGIGWPGVASEPEAGQWSWDEEAHALEVVVSGEDSSQVHILLAKAEQAN